jgi:hypothetical protein
MKSALQPSCKHLQESVKSCTYPRSNPSLSRSNHSDENPRQTQQQTETQIYHHRRNASTYITEKPDRAEARCSSRRKIRAGVKKLPRILGELQATTRSRSRSQWTLMVWRVTLTAYLKARRRRVWKDRDRSRTLASGR